MAASAVLTALAALLFLSLSEPLSETQYLLLINERTGKTLHSIEAPNGAEFSVTYIHSVNKSPVTEYFQVIDGQIYLTALRYQSFGAGMPSEQTDGQVSHHQGGSMLVTGYNRLIPRLCCFISRVEGHTFDMGGASLPLNTLDEPGEPVLFTITRTRYKSPQ